MDWHKRSLSLGAAVILCAVGLRLLPRAAPLVTNVLQDPDVVSFLFYLETGRVIRPLPEQTEPVETTLQSFEETQSVSVSAPLPAFLPEDTQLVKLKYHAQLKPDLEELLCRPLEWNLMGDEPTVLIVHSHATESYTKSKGEKYQESSAYRTLDERYNMISVGAYLSGLLEEAGIRVVHATDLHDYPSYSGSYVNSRKTVQSYLKRYPTIRMVLDLHRDAADDGYGGQMDTSAQIDGQESARLMMVVGTNAGGMNHPDWEENLALALKLHVVLEKQYPGLCRTISFRTQRFNQDLSSGAMLIEVGAAGNTRQEALVATKALAEGIIALAQGTATSDSTN